MAGWYKEQDTARGTAHALLGALPRARGFRRDRNQAVLEAQTADIDVPASGLRDEHVSLVTAYIGAYPDDAEERSLCNRRLHEQPERPAA
jgi:hypothetical protein